MPASGGGLTNVHSRTGQGASSTCLLDNGRSAQDFSPSVVFVVPPVQQILLLALAQRPGGNLLGCLHVSLCCAHPCMHVDGPGWAVAFIQGRGQKLPLSL